MTSRRARLYRLGVFVKPWQQVDVTCTSTAYPGWKDPVRVHFRRQGSAWTLVGLTRRP